MLLFFSHFLSSFPWYINYFHFLPLNFHFLNFFLHFHLLLLAILLNLLKFDLYLLPIIDLTYISCWSESERSFNFSEKFSFTGVSKDSSSGENSSFTFGAIFSLFVNNGIISLSCSTVYLFELLHFELWGHIIGYLGASQDYRIL